MALVGHNKDMNATEIMQDIRLQLLNSGESSFVELLDAMRIYSKNGDQKTVTKLGLLNALQRVSIFLSLPQVGKLMLHFGSPMSIAEFSRQMKGKYTARRERMLKRVFDYLDTNENGKLDFKEMMSKFKAEEHPGVKANLISAEVAADRMKILFEAEGKRESVTYEEFRQLYEAMSVTIPKNDDMFCGVLASVWGIVEYDEYYGIDKKHPKVQTVLKVLREKIRQKTHASLGNFSVTLMKNFRHFDTEGCESVDSKSFTIILARFGIVLDKVLNKALFAVFAEKENGKLMLPYKKFVDSLFEKPAKQGKKILNKDGSRNILAQ